MILDSLYTKMAVIRQTKWPPEGHDREAVLLEKDMCSPVTAI